MNIHYSKPLMAHGKRVSVPGCDDAPVIAVQLGETPKQVTLIYPYYENPQMLRRQVEHWQKLPDWSRQYLRAVIVDDGSPDTPAVSVLADMDHPFSLRLLRLDVDVRWNWLAARNLGVSVSNGWCLLTDIDHMVPQTTILAAIYRFMRDEHTGESIHPHPNSWLMTTEMFWKIGGYDEALSGFYGTDGEYRRRCVKTAPVRIMTDKLVRHEFQLDSSTVRYQRKQPEDAAVRALVGARGKGWKPKVLSYPYHEVAL
jgi:hypothetical protein